MAGGVDAATRAVRVDPGGWHVVKRVRRPAARTLVRELVTLPGGDVGRLPRLGGVEAVGAVHGAGAMVAVDADNGEPPWQVP